MGCGVPGEGIMAHVWQTAAVAALAAIFLLASDQASAQIPEDEQKCIVELNKGFAKVVKAQSRENVKCVKFAGRGRVASAEVCLTADSRGKVAKAKSRNEKRQTRRCTGVTPPFGATDAATGNQVAVLMELDLIHDIFGSDLDAAIIDASVDRAGANCQTEVAKIASRCQDVRLKRFNKCKTGGLDDGSIGDASGLEACIRRNLRGVARAVPRCWHFGAFQKKCATTDILRAFPGECGIPEPFGPFGLFTCLDPLINRRVCLALNEVDGLNRDCD